MTHISKSHFWFCQWILIFINLKSLIKFEIQDDSVKPLHCWTLNHAYVGGGVYLTVSDCSNVSNGTNVVQCLAYGLLLNMDSGTNEVMVWYDQTCNYHMQHFSSVDQTHESLNKKIFYCMQLRKYSSNHSHTPFLENTIGVLCYSFSSVKRRSWVFQ